MAADTEALQAASQLEQKDAACQIYSLATKKRAGNISESPDT